MNMILAKLQQWRDGNRIRHSTVPPGGAALWPAWRQLRQLAGGDQSREVTLELAGRTLRGGCRDLTEVFDDVFLREAYRADLSGTAPVILDCGANLGLASLYFHWCHPQARITAFEPSPAIQDLLRANLAGLPGVSIEAVACGKTGGQLPFHLVPGHSTGSSTTIRWPDATQTVLVPVVRVSDFIQGPVDLLKLDVEGAEWEVLEELRDSGKLRQVARLIIEYHHRLQDGRKLSGFLRLLEEAGLDYNVLGARQPGELYHLRWQSLMIHAWRRTP